jgi:hypothetical protein
MASDELVRTEGPLRAESDWYDEDGFVIVTGDDRFHGYAKRMREMVESLSAWGDPALWQYNLDLLRDAIAYEQQMVDSERRKLVREAEKAVQP